MLVSVSRFCFIFGAMRKLHLRGVPTLGTKELARDVEFFTSDNHNLLAVEDLLGNDAGQPTKKVALGIDDDLLAVQLVFPTPHP